MNGFQVKVSDVGLTCSCIAGGNGIQLILTKIRRGTLGIVVLTVLLVVCGWFIAATYLSPKPAEEVDSDTPLQTYRWAGALATASDVVVLGKVNSLAFTRPSVVGVSDSGSPEPSRFYEVEIKDVLKGDIYANDIILVGRATPGQFKGVPITAMDSDKHYVLFLGERTPNDIPLTSIGRVFYVPVNFDLGVFDVTPLGSPGPSYADETVISSRTIFFDWNFGTLRQLRKLVADSAGMQPDDYDGKIIIYTD